MGTGFGRRQYGAGNEIDFSVRQVPDSSASSGISMSSIAGIGVAIMLFAVGYVGASSIVGGSLASVSPEAASGADHQISKHQTLVRAQAAAVEALRPQLPMRIDSMMTVFDVRASGVKFTYHYRVNGLRSRINIAKFISVGRRGLVRNACGKRAMRRVLEAGGVYGYQFYDKKQEFIQSFNLTKSDCV